MSENKMQEGMNLKKWGILLRLSIFLGLNFEVKWENCVVCEVKSTLLVN